MQYLLVFCLLNTQGTFEDIELLNVGTLIDVLPCLFVGLRTELVDQFCYMNEQIDKCD